MQKYTFLPLSVIFVFHVKVYSQQSILRIYNTFWSDNGHIPII